MLETIRNQEKHTTLDTRHRTKINEATTKTPPKNPHTQDNTEN